MIGHSFSTPSASLGQSNAVGDVENGRQSSIPPCESPSSNSTMEFTVHSEWKRRTFGSAQEFCLRQLVVRANWIATTRSANPVGVKGPRSQARDLALLEKRIGGEKEEQRFVSCWTYGAQKIIEIAESMLDFFSFGAPKFRSPSPSFQMFG